MKKYLQTLWDRAEKVNQENILSLLECNPDATLLDCGCGDGEVTLKVSAKVGTKNIYCIEIVEDLRLKKY